MIIAAPALWLPPEKPAIMRANDLSGLPSWWEMRRRDRARREGMFPFPFFIRPTSAAIPPEVKLLLHCDGSDGSTSFPDSSNSAHTVTANGNAQVDTAQYKFGGASALFDGTGDYLSLADNTDWDFGLSSFTIDFWARPNTLADNLGLIGFRVLTTSGWSIYLTATGEVRVSNDDSVSNLVTSVNTLSTGSWQHVAVVRKGTGSTDFNIAINGTFGSSPASGNINLDTSGGLVIGRYFTDYGAGANYYNGWLDEIRVMNGLAEWTSNFTPPSAPY